MRRTYKSKKETAGAIDPRDVMLTLDAKSSLFDAFYIKNIKQTKKDISVGSTTQFTAPSKVRKQKFVKKLKKQEELFQARESNSMTAFLTPDKSFRVNKVPDLFDQLLNSSSNKVQTPEPVNVFKKVPAIHRKTYAKKKSKKKKIKYFSSDSSDSDKENFNSSEEANKTTNTSDIKSHQLLIEKETKTNPNYIDESIDNIVNNISIFTKKRDQRVSSPRNVYKNFTKYAQPLQTSPLCSTPFLEKYRGASIYRFSPIPINLSDSLNCDVVEDNSYATDGQYITHRENNYKIDKQNSTDTTIKENIEYKVPEENCKTIETVNEKTTAVSISCKSIGNTNNVTEFQSPILPNRTMKTNKREIWKLPTDLSCMQTSEMEPFYGFKNSYSTENIKLDSVNECTESPNHTILSKDLSLNVNLNTVKDKVQSFESNTSSDSESSESDSLYDTCNSDDNIEQQAQNIQPIVVVERLNDSVFYKYFSQAANYSVDTNNYDTGSDSTDYTSVKESDSVSNKSSINSYISENSVGDDFNVSYGDCENNGSFVSTEIISNDNSIEATPDDECISFVTTRRKNGYRNDSFIGLDNSIIGAGSHGFEHVLSNKSSLDNTNYVTLTENVEDTLKIDGEEMNQNEAEFINKSNKISEVELSPKVNRILTRKSTRESFKKSRASINNRVPQIEETASPNQNDPLNVSTRKSSRRYRDSNAGECQNSLDNDGNMGNELTLCEKTGIILQPGKRWERSLSIYRRLTTMADHFDHSILEEVQGKGRKYRQSVLTTLEMQDLKGSFHNDSINSRRSTFVSKPSRSTIKIVRESSTSRASLCSSIACEDLDGFIGEDCDDTIVELSKLSIADSEHEVTVIEKFHDSSNRRTTARDYVLRRCNQADVLPFDECYPDPVLKNCRKIGEGVYGEVFLWRAGDGRARVLKVIPIAGDIKINGEQQKDFHEIISEIVIAMELSALRAPIPDIERHFNEGKSLESLDLHSVENATDAFNEVVKVRCARGPYPGRLLELWELYDECKGSENDSPATLPPHQHYVVLELASAGQDLESYCFRDARQAHALFRQIAFGLAVAEEAYQFEHRDLHWGNVLISPTDDKFAWFVLRGTLHRVSLCGVRGAVIDYSLSRATLGRCALYNDLADDDALFDAVGDYQFQLYRLMRDKLGNDWKNFEPYTNVLWLHYTVDKMITALRYTRTNTKVHKHYISKLKEIKNRVLECASATDYVLDHDDP